MVYWDMDGVLATYSRDDYSYSEETNSLAYLNIEHYFLNRPIDSIGMDLFRACVKLLPDDTCVLTGVTNDSKRRFEHIIDKMTWIHSCCPEFDVGSKFIALSTDKRNYITGIRGMTLTANDVLIDDYNINLYKWMAAGGTSIKYLNGINSKSSWSGRTINYEELEGTCEGALSYMSNLLYELFGRV